MAVATGLASGVVLRRQLEGALQAMTLLQPFDPRLAGPLVAGIADPQSPVVVHVCADHVDEVLHALAGHGIPTRTIQTRLHIPREATQPLPGITFLAGEQEFRILVFNEAQFRQRLRVGDDPEPSKRLGLAAVRRWLESL